MNKLKVKFEKIIGDCLLLIVNRRSAFTLIELMVAMSIFIILMVVVTGSFVNALKNQRTMNLLMNINNNSGLVLEQMARDIRTGFNFVASDEDSASSKCVSGSFDTLNFKNFAAAEITYRFFSDKVERGEKRVEETIPTYTQLTASTIKVNRLCFIVSPLMEIKKPQRITILLGITSANQNIRISDMNIQTTVSARTLPQDL